MAGAIVVSSGGSYETSAYITIRGVQLSLTILLLGYNRITNLSPLVELTNLTFINLGATKSLTGRPRLM